MKATSFMTLTTPTTFLQPHMLKVRATVEKNHQTMERQRRQELHVRYANLETIILHQVAAHSAMIYPSTLEYACVARYPIFDPLTPSEVLIPRDFTKAKKSKESSHWKRAIEKEMRTMATHDVTTWCLHRRSARSLVPYGYTRESLTDCSRRDYVPRGVSQLAGADFGST